MNLFIDRSKPRFPRFHVCTFCLHGLKDGNFSMMVFTIVKKNPVHVLAGETQLSVIFGSRASCVNVEVAVLGVSVDVKQHFIIIRSVHTHPCRLLWPLSKMFTYLE